jgi:DNA repair protein RecO (recombination protein O)
MFEMKVGRQQQQAVILSRINYSEADLIVRFFTAEHGKIEGMAKHGRKSRKRFANALSPSSLADLTFTHKPGRDLVWLEKGDLVRAFDGLGQNVHHLALAGQALELVDAFCKPLDPAPQIFELLLWILDRLEQGLRPEEGGFIFQIKLLGLTGFGPNLSACPVCGRATGTGPPVCLKTEAGGVACRPCAPGGFAVSPGTIKIMSLIQSVDREKIDRIRVSEQARAEAGSFLAAYLRHILGRDLKSFRFLERIKQPAAGSE